MIAASYSVMEVHGTSCREWRETQRLYGALRGIGDYPVPLPYRRTGVVIGSLQVVRKGVTLANLT